MLVCVCACCLPTLSLFVNMHTHMCRKVGVCTYERVCECLDNLLSVHCSLSVYLYTPVCLRPLSGFDFQGIVGDFVGVVCKHQQQ